MSRSKDIAEILGATEAENTENVSLGAGGGGGSSAGGILEMFGGICAGQTFVVSSGSYTLPNVTGVQELSPSYADITGSSITYTPPVGTKNVIYKYNVYTARPDNNAMWHGRVYLDADEIVARRFTIGDGRYTYGMMTTVVASFQCDAASQDLNTGALTSWTTPKTIKIQGREYTAGSTTFETKLHEIRWFDGNTGSAQVHRPSIEIIAIG